MALTYQKEVHFGMILLTTITYSGAAEKSLSFIWNDGTTRE